MERHYVEFMYLGSMVTENYVVEVAEKDPAKIEAPRTCFGYRFFDRIEAEVDGERVLSQAKNYSGI